MKEDKVSSHPEYKSTLEHISKIISLLERLQILTFQKKEKEAYTLVFTALESQFLRLFLSLLLLLRFLDSLLG